jgi:hypothetical protein
MAQAQADYVTAAHAIGFPPFHILMRDSAKLFQRFWRW